MIKKLTLGVLGTIGVIALILFWLARPELKRTEREGPYELRYYTESFAGHRGTRVDVYYAPARTSTLVARNVGKRFPAPDSPSRLLYEHCYNDDGKGCGVFLFDASTMKSRRISNRNPVQTNVLRTPWSPDAKAVALLEQYGGNVVNLTTGASVELQEPLALAGPLRSIGNARWESDGTLRIGVWVYTDPNPPYRNSVTEHWIVDPANGSVTVATTPP